MNLELKSTSKDISHLPTCLLTSLRNRKHKLSTHWFQGTGESTAMLS